MVKRGFAVFFNNKKGLELAKTLVYILIAIGVVLLMGWAIFNAAKKIFG